jgi:hypothetical protein
LSPEEQEKRMASKQFQARFSEEEQALIKRGIENLPPPPPAPPAAARTAPGGEQPTAAKQN